MQIQFAQSISGPAIALTSTPQDILTVPITVVGSGVNVELSAVGGFVKGATGNVYLVLVWDGTTIATSVVSAPSSQAMVITCRAVVPGVAAGAHTAKLQAYHNTSGSNIGGAGYPTSLIVMEW